MIFFSVYVYVCIYTCLLYVHNYFWSIDTHFNQFPFPFVHLFTHEARLYFWTGEKDMIILLRGVDQIRKEYQTQWQHRKGTRFISWKFSFCHESSLHCQTKHHVPPSIQPTSSYFSSSSSSTSSFFSFTPRLVLPLVPDDRSNYIFMLFRHEAVRDCSEINLSRSPACSQW